MELSQHMSSSLLEELIMAPKIDSPFPNEYNNINLHNNLWAFDQAPEVHFPSTNASSLLELISPPTDFNYPCPFTEFQPFFDVTSPHYGSFYDKDDLPAMGIQEEYASANVESSGGNASGAILDCASVFEDGSTMSSSCFKSEMDLVGHMGIGIFNVDLYGEKRIMSKGKKPDGQPSKNLMAERRRRKRLNDRLSMLRSIVPKISKMDRTSILGDTIDYMKELLDKIHKLREEEGIDDNILNQINPTGTSLKDLKPNEMLVRNPPKFDVAIRNKDTRVEVCCTPKPGLLLSTLSTLDALGLDVQQCVISCFNDFSLQASCLERQGGENQSLLSSEDMKQALFRNAGYGGRCL